MCPATFNKDTETYIKKLEAIGQGVETIQLQLAIKKQMQSKLLKLKRTDSDL